MSRRWIRLDANCFESEWLVGLSPLAQHCWTRLLLHVKLSGKLGRAKILGPAAVHRLWGIPARERAAMLEAAHNDGAIITEDAEWVVTGWARYQEPDLTALERKRKERAIKAAQGKSAGGHGDVTPVTRDTEEKGRDPSRDPRPPTETHRTSTPRDASHPPEAGASDDDAQGRVSADSGADSNAGQVSADLGLDVGLSPPPDPAIWMHQAWERRLGTSMRSLNLTTSRRQKYRAMYQEQLRQTGDARVAWEAVLEAVTRSKHHMENRAYQMPESLLRSPERRERWVQQAMAMIQNGGNGEYRRRREEAELEAYLRSNSP